jgi:hypothetical protein
VPTHRRRIYQRGEQTAGRGRADALAGMEKNCRIGAYRLTYP